jgi:type IV pilus assembly protein PilC
VKEAAHKVEKGFSLAVAISRDPNFPPIMGQMVSVGEETGKIDEVLLKVAHYFETESEQMVKTLTTAMEPIIMVILGLGVGFLVFSVITPIYKLTSSF